MTPSRDWFTNYRSICGGVVLIGNNVTCKVVGIGIVRIKLYNGVVRTFSNVCHMPNLRKNILSLDIFDSHGYKYTGEDGVLRINKGALGLIKRKLVNGRSILQEAQFLVMQ